MLILVANNCLKTGKFSKWKSDADSCRNYSFPSRTWITHLLAWSSLVIPSMGLNAIAWDQVARISPMSVSLNFFARALVTGPMGTRIGSEYVSSHMLLPVTTFSSFPSSCHSRMARTFSWVDSQFWQPCVPCPPTPHNAVAQRHCEFPSSSPPKTLPL